MTLMTNQEYLERIKKLQEYLIKNNIDLAILNQNPDIYYYTGSILPLYLIISSNKEPFLLARKAINRIQEQVKHMPLEYFTGSRDLIKIFEKKKIKHIKKIGFNLDATSYSTVIRMNQFFPNAEIIDLSWDIKLIRMVKSKAEISIHKKAGEIIAQVPKIIKDNFHPNMTELDMSMIIENYFRKNQSSTLYSKQEGINLNYGICSAGVNSLAESKFDGVCSGKGINSALPFGASFDLIPKNVPIILDYACCLDGYHVDQTRMFCWGEPAKEFLKAFEAMLEIERNVVTNLKPGVKWKNLYEQALILADKLGYKNEFMGLGTEKVRFIGHGVGLLLDEPPYIAPKMDYPIEKNMVIAIEPKVAILKVGIIGIENTYLVTDSSPELITNCSNNFIIC